MSNKKMFFFADFAFKTKKIRFWGIFGPPYCGIGATILIGREMLCLPYGIFFIHVSNSSQSGRIMGTYQPGSHKNLCSMCADSSTSTRKEKRKKCQVSGAWCQLSGVSCQVSGVRCQVLDVRRQGPGVRCKVSGVT